MKALKCVHFPSLCLPLALIALVSAHESGVAYAGSIRETTALFPPSRAQLPRFARPSPLAEQASAGFSLLSPRDGEDSLQPPKRRFSGMDDHHDKNAEAIYPTCGPAPDANSLACYNLVTGEQLADVPLPGQLTTTPQRHGKDWYVGTSRGFFIRYDSNGVWRTPSFGLHSQLFFGPDSRFFMKQLASGANTAVTSPRADVRLGWTWHASANAEFIGTPQFGGGRVYVQTANQSLNAYDLESGKLVWGVRLAPDVQLRLLSTSLVLHERGLLVGTSDGTLLLLDPKNGQSLWKLSISGGVMDRFQAVAAPVLALSEGIIVSNAESVTQRINWETRSSDWSYGAGSVVQPKYDEGSVYVAGSDGKLYKLDVRTGQLRWATPLPTTSPLVAMTLLKKDNIVMVAAANGAIFALRMADGKIAGRSESSSYGPVVGDFFAGRADQGEVCLSYRTPGYACWAWNAADSGKEF